jgi:uncharacterized protein (DUF2267 family)
MKHDAFIGTVQSRGDYASRGEAESATRAVLTTLGARITEGEAADLAAQLPAEVDRHLTEAAHGQQFDAEEFRSRVADRGEFEAVVDDPENATHAVVGVVAEAVGTDEFRDVVSQLPKDEGYGDLLTTSVQ